MPALSLTPFSKRSVCALGVLFAMLYSGLASADLSTTVNYSCMNHASGTECTLPPTGLQASTGDSTPIVVGDVNGGASAQSTFGTLSGTASGAWKPDSPFPSYSSAGNATSRATDTITLQGGTGSVQITAVLNVTGTYTAPASYTNGSFSIIPQLSFSASQVAALSQVFLYKTVGAGEINFATTATGSWSSSDGIFTVSGNNGGLTNVSPSGQLSLTALLPYNQPIQFTIQVFVAGNHSVATSAVATAQLILPPGTTMTATSGQTYDPEAATADVPMPHWAVLLLGLTLMGVASGARPLLRQRIL